MRAIARSDFDQAQRVAAWPIREGLLCLLDQFRNFAIESYRFDVIRWCLAAPHIAAEKRPRYPEIPAILKDERSAKK